MKKVSVIVPVYNAEKYLHRCIESIINQTLNGIEIILINDGSTDNSLNICKQYEEIDPRIKVIDKENSGPSASRNIGIENANGEYITFVDSDDWIELDMLENLYNKVKQFNSPMIISNYFKNYTDKEVINCLNIKENCLDKKKINKYLILPLIGKSEFEEENHILGFGAPWGRLFNLDIIKSNKIKFKEDLIIGEDVLFNIEFLDKVSNISLSKSAYYHYFDNSSSIMRSYKKNCWNLTKKYISSVSNFLVENNYMHQVGDRFKIMKLDGITKAIFNECKSTNEKNIYEKIRYINYICRDEVTKSTLKEVSNIKLDFKRKIGKALIKYNMSTILYIYYSRNNRSK